MRLVEIVFNRVGVVREACEQILVYRLLLGYAFNEVGYDIVVLILPWLLVAPVAVEVFLNLLHLLDGCFLRILLKP